MQTKSDIQYIQTKKVLRGEIKIDLLKQNLMDWVSNRFEINVINIEYDKIDQGKRDRLNVIVKKRIDAEKMHHKGPDYSGYKKEYQQEILEAFLKIYDESNFMDFKAEYKPWVCYHVFDDVAISEANGEIGVEKLSEITKEYSEIGIWQIVQFFGATIVFLFKAEQLEKLDKGKAESLRKRLFKEIKVHDEFDILNEDRFTINFDTKENLDKKYEGNILNYFR